MEDPKKVSYCHNYRSIDGALQRIWYNAVNSSATRKSRGREEAGKIDIDLDYLKNLWKTQDGRCYYSGIPMNFDKAEWRVSIERLDPDKGYIYANVALCCLEFNSRVQWSEQKIDRMLEILDKDISESLVDFEIEKKQRKSYEKIVKSVIDGVDHYNCTHCKTIKSRDDFSSYKVENGCKECISKRDRNKKLTPRGTLQNLVQSAKNATKARMKKDPESKKRDYSLDIDFDYLVELFNAQKGLCAYSGIPLAFGKYKDNDWKVSIDRIDPRKGYTKDNVCLVCLEFNVSDHTVTFGDDSFGSSGWSALKFDMFVAHVQHKRGLINKEELDLIIAMQKQVISRPVGTYRSSTRTYHPTVNLVADIKRAYGKIYLMTSPSGKQYIGATEVLFQGHSSYFAHFRKYKCAAILKELKTYREDEFTFETLAWCKKEALETVQDTVVEQYGTLVPAGLNPKKRVTEKIKQQISNSLIENTVRFGHDGRELPKYVKFDNWTDREGYSITSHPLCKKKYFVDKNLSNEEKYDACIAKLEELNKKMLS